MRILVLGATGFVGRHIVAALEAGGHAVIRGGRNAASAGMRWMRVDYARDHAVDVWLPRLAGIDAVVNAVGILRETSAATFDALHVDAPVAMFRACVEAGVQRVVQISALGADENAASRYHASKKQADDALAALPVSSAIVQPSLVYGEDGASARLFTTLAALPLVPLPGRGGQRVQPVHVEDLAALVVALVGPHRDVGGRVAAVGPRPLTLREWLGTLRAAMGLPEPRFLAVPMPLVRAAARVAEHLPRVLLDRETLAMLERGNTGDAHLLSRILGRSPRDPAGFVTDAAQTRTAARLRWVLPLARAAVAALWIATAIVSLGVFPVDESYALLARVGITGATAPVALYGAALLDLALGAGVYLVRRRRWLWRAQIAVILAYTAIITVKLPEYWLHPYGPLTKNLPLLALLVLLHELDEEG